MEDLLPLKMPPGIYRNGTEYQSKGRWFEASLVRFYEGSIRPVGGWEELVTSGGAVTFTGTVRRMLAVNKNADGSAQLVIGTNQKIYTYSQLALTDRTPTSPTALTTGGVDTVAGGAYGAGNYGDYFYGEGDPASYAETEAATWQLDNFGDRPVGVLTSDRKIWYWDTSSAEFAIVDASAPDCDAIVVTPERFLVALASDGGGADDKRYVQWADQESLTTWDATTLNQAGGFTLSGTGKIMCGRRGRNETLIWTDTDLHAMRYIGGSLVYAFEQVGSECGIISRNAVAMVDGRAIWMGKNGFFAYDGYVRNMPCEVSDYVFSDFNRVQRHKVFATTVSQFGEIWWFYPAAASTVPNRYVIYNYRENHWAFGTLTRTAGIDRGTYLYPLMAGQTNIYHHERGWDHASASIYIEGGPLELGFGQRIMDVKQIVPDEGTATEPSLGNVQVKVYTRMYPTATETEWGAYSTANPTDVRITARQIRMRYEQVTDGVGEWRVGEMRIDASPTGGRR